MSLRTFLSIAAVIAIVFGVGLVLLPGPLTSLYGVTLDPAGVYVAQLFGAMLVGMGVLNWSSRDMPDLSGVLLGNFVGAALGLVLTLIAELSRTGGVNMLGWLTVVIFLFLAFGNGYYRFLAQGMLHRITR